MQRQLIRIFIACLIAALTFVGVRSITHYHNKIEVQKLELKSNQLKAQTLEMEYDQALKQLDNKHATEKQLKDAEQKLQQLEQQKQQLEQQLQAKRQAQASDTVYAAAAPPAVTGTNVYMDFIFQHESSGNPLAVNGIGACGLGQSYPCSKLSAVCGWPASVSCQIGYFSNYAVARYGSWAKAYYHWLNYSNW